MTQAADAQPPATVFDRLLKAATLRLVFTRVLAIGFLGLGLYEWAELLGAIKTSAPDFFSLNVQSQALQLFFAVANLVAAVGLWLLATWGVVVWLSAAFARILRHTLFASAFGWTPIATTVECLGILLFIVLLVLEARAEQRDIIQQRESRRNRAREP